MLKPWLIDAIVILLEFLIDRIRKKNDVPVKEMRRLSQKIADLQDTISRT